VHVIIAAGSRASRVFRSARRFVSVFPTSSEGVLGHTFSKRLADSCHANLGLRKSGRPMATTAPSLTSGDSAPKLFRDCLPVGHTDAGSSELRTPHGAPISYGRAPQTGGRRRRSLLFQNTTA